jgi:hypothetical protein
MPEIQIPMRETRTMLQELNQQQRIYLVGLVQSPAWQVLLDIMESQCVLQETKLLNTEASDREKVLVEHTKAQMMWQFFVGVQQKVKYEINEATDKPKVPHDVVSSPFDELGE